MGFRFQKRIKILKGFTLNLSKSGASWTIGRQGASININKEGKVTGSVGIPGTGLSYRHSFNQKSSSRESTKRVWLLFGIVLLLVLGYLLMR